MRRTHIKRACCPADIPAGEPKRYVNPQGYVVLRWRVGTDRYVDITEHRFVMGFPDGHVHHKDGNKQNNAPENLEVLSPSEHGTSHGRNRWVFDRSEARHFYESGWLLVELAECYGVDTAILSRGLRRAGCQMRTPAESRRDPMPEDCICAMHRVGMRVPHIAVEVGTTHHKIRRVLRNRGIRGRSGRPARSGSADV